MRPRKKVLIYHPDECKASLFRYAMDVTLDLHVSIAETLEELSWRKDIDVTALWNAGEIEIRNPHTLLYRTLPIQASTYELMESVRTCLARKRGPRKERVEVLEEVVEEHIETAVVIETEVPASAWVDYSAYRDAWRASRKSGLAA